MSTRSGTAWPPFALMAQIPDHHHRADLTEMAAVLAGIHPRIDAIATALAALPDDQAMDAVLTTPTLDHLAHTHLPPHPSS